MQRYFQFLVFFIVILYCSYAYQFFFYSGITGIKPLYWYLITACLALSVVLVDQNSAKAPRYFIIWLWVFLCYSIFNFLYSSQSAVAQQALIQNIQSIVLLLSFLVIFQQGGVRNVKLAILIVVLFAVPMNFIDFISPMWSKVPGRASGIYMNPNTSGKILVFAMVASITVVPSKFRTLYCMFVGAGVLVTFSRTSWLIWALALTVLAGSGYIAFKRKSVSLVFVGLLSCLVIYSLITGGALGLISDSPVGQYLKPSTLARLGGADITVDSSVAGRTVVALKSLDVFQQYPWFGAGLGYTREWDYNISPHNMYLMMAAEGGMLGLALFISLLVILWRNTDNIGRLLVVLFAVRSISSHNMLDQATTLVMLVLIVLSYTNVKAHSAHIKKELSGNVSNDLVS